MLFVPDAPQVRGTVHADERASMQNASIRGTLRRISVAAVLAWPGCREFRISACGDEKPHRKPPVSIVAEPG